MKTLIKRNIGGFTLIELLVVVLIIGILSSVALPQYTKAVNKARAVEAWTAGKAITDAEKVYFLENGRYTEDFESLGISIPELKNWEFHVVNDESYPVQDTGCFYIVGKNQLEGISLMYNYNGSGMACSADDSKVCASFIPCPPTKFDTGCAIYTCSF
ncbi:MAG: prepilin-type N-terminal cleavage/methylation domain-containing protein [Elusimicrobiaceae bacterium]|nr:prepilin-type N-terminal cleavage/methylation domain-containing protein [Elusimicrobiaceae bacterium]